MKAPIRRKVIISMVKKEFAQALRDPRMRGILFGSPLLMIIIFGYAVNTDVKDIRMAVMDEDKTAMSRAVIDKFTGSGYFKLVSYLYSPKELGPLMDSGEAEVFVHIAKDLSKTVKSGGTSEMQVIVDGTDSNRAAVISSYVNVIVQNFFLGRYFDRIKSAVLLRSVAAPFPGGGAAVATLSPGVSVIERTFFNPDLLSRNFFLPGIIGFIISLITIMLTAMSIVKERETGTMEQIIVSPIRPMEFIMGKTVPFAIVGFVDMCIVTGVAIFWFGVPFRGTILFLFLSGLLYIVSTLSVGIYISTISRTQQQAMLSFFLFFIPAILFSGFVFPIYAMPVTIQAVTYFDPLMYFIIIIRGVFLKGVGIEVLWKELGALLIIGVFLLFLSSRRLRRRME
jgi:ABC-2 type transport system permease protein